MMPPRWEHKIVRITGNPVNGLNALGLEGWEPWAIVDQELEPSASPDMPPAIIAWRVAIKRPVVRLIT